MTPRASLSRWHVALDTPMGDPEPIETAEPTLPAIRPGPHVRPIVLEASAGNAAVGSRSRLARERAARAA